MEVQYLGDSASPRASIADNYAGEGRGVVVAGTPSTTPWTAGTAAARANSTVYALGDAIKLATNTGRLFFCSVAGTSTTSEPAGYATAIDGGTITDGSATFRAGWRQTLSLSVTPQRAGLLSARVHTIDSQATPTKVYIDPLVKLT